MQSGGYRILSVGVTATHFALDRAVDAAFSNMHGGALTDSGMR